MSTHGVEIPKVIAEKIYGELINPTEEDIVLYNRIKNDVLRDRIFELSPDFTRSAIERRTQQLFGSESNDVLKAQT